MERTVNWRRGLWRAWIAIALLWIAAVAGVGWLVLRERSPFTGAFYYANAGDQFVPTSIRASLPSPNPFNQFDGERDAQADARAASPPPGFVLDAPTATSPGRLRYELSDKEVFGLKPVTDPRVLRRLEGWTDAEFALVTGAADRIEFPDGTELVASRARCEGGAADVCRRFWAERWQRRAVALWPAMLVGLVPPAALLALGGLALWVARGFQPPWPPREA